MNTTRLMASLITVGGLLLSVATPAADRVHDDAFWTALKDHDFKLPAGSSAEALSFELLGMLASTDPRLRDGIGYEAFAAWTYRDELLQPATLEALRLQLMPLARARLGEGESDGVFGRSFAMLCLSVLAAADLRRPFLNESAYRELLALGLEALTRERDLRGWVPDKGWAHATAHTADLLKFLARSPRLAADDAARIVDSVAYRLRTAGQVFVWGEDVRLASALRSLVARPDFDSAPFANWFAQVRKDREAVWRDDFDPARYVAVRSQLNALAQLAARLRAGPPGGSAEALRASIEALLADTD
jgi:hypothetical protein